MNDSKPGQGALVCIPTYNESDNVRRIVPAVLESVSRANVLIIDDASPDGTGQLADELAARDERVFVLHRTHKQGLGRAYLAAFDWALGRGYDFVIEFDADFSHDPAYLPEMLRRLGRADVVIGSRRVPGGKVVNWSLARRFISAGGSAYARAVLGVPIRDLTGGFNGFRKDALVRIGYESIVATGYSFQVEIKYRAIKRGLRVEEMAIVFPDRVRGKSKMSPKIFGEALWAVWRLRLFGG